MAAQTAAEIAAAISASALTRISRVNGGLADNVAAIASSVGEAVASAITDEDEQSATLTVLAGTGASQGASLIGVRDVATIYTATTVEGALAEVKALADAAIGVTKKTATITSADLVALGAVQSGTANVGTALPANARVVGANVTVGTKFQNAGDSDTTVVDVGISGTAELHIKDASLKTTGQKGPNGATSWPGRNAGAEQVIATFASDVNFDTLTAGSVTIDIFYYVLA